MPGPARENSSGPSGPQSNLTIAQAVAAYLTSPAQERASYAQELNAFVRWFGAHRTVGSIIPHDLERYQEQLASESRTDTTQRLEALRAFLFEARKQGWIDRNLAVEIKLKKKKTAASAKGTSSRELQENGGVRLTREGYDKLARELQHLETEMRPKIAHELRTAAADKDFRENAPYDVAKQHQGEVEARIRQLKDILQTGQVVEVERSSTIDLGSQVTLRDLSEDEEIVFTLVGPGEIDPRHGKISILSPVGKALAGRTVGDEVEVDVPAGKLRLRVEKVHAR